MSKDRASTSAKLSRRGLLVGAAASPLAAIALPAAAETRPSEPVDHVNLNMEVPFYGSGGQAGVETPPQRYIHFMTFDLTTVNPRDLQVLLARWSAAIAQMAKGETIGQVEPAREHGIGFDTGEALDLGPASLTVTVGLGPEVFSERLGLAAMKPQFLRELEHLPSDAFLPQFTGGDLSLQACADDPQVAYHAIRDLARIAKDTGAASTRWTVMGFGRASAGRNQATPRNLLGYKDGTRNIAEPEDFDRFVWTRDDPVWGGMGSYQVARKIKMHIENWDVDRVSDQNNVFGRFKVSGAPLTGTDEFDTPDFGKTDAEGNHVIPRTSHISLAAHENNDGIKILRRSYNYTEGINEVGLLSAGLLFISYQNDPAHFERLQQRLGAADRLNEYISHIGSAIFFVPPAPEEGHYIGQQMFG
ncbi:Dyp-type peroxidase [Martelella endophytica]|nr:Dyp-type peroxidase [Martelella endophytica]